MRQLVTLVERPLDILQDIPPSVRWISCRTSRRPSCAGRRCSLSAYHLISIQSAPACHGWPSMGFQFTPRYDSYMMQFYLRL